MKWHFWFDDCSVQNKNKNLCITSIYISFNIYIVNNTNIEKVDLKFRYKGHTFLADDSIGNIEKKLRQKEIFYNIFITSTIIKRPLKVIIITKIAQVK